MLAAMQTARAASTRVTVLMMSLAADEIVMSKHAVLGPVDPQLGQSPAASLLQVVEQSRSWRSTTDAGRRRAQAPDGLPQDPACVDGICLTQAKTSISCCLIGQAEA